MRLMRRLASSSASASASASTAKTTAALDLQRVFSVVAHVDHGKTTLSNALIRRCEELQRPDGRPTTDGRDAAGGVGSKSLDGLTVEQERGITVKSKAVRLLYGRHHLSLVDTPGHADFSWEVRRALTACEGVLLAVDAQRGVQAQTLQVWQAAAEAGLAIVPVVTKCDLPTARPQEVADDIAAVFGLEWPALAVSARTGQGLDELLQAVVERVPAPRGSAEGPLRALVFDCRHDPHRGVVLMVRLMDGTVRAGTRIRQAAGEGEHEVAAVGVVEAGGPGGATERECDELVAGQVGWLVCGLRSMRDILVGDTLVPVGSDGAVEPILTDLRRVQPSVFAGVYPADAGEFPALAVAIEKLVLTDPIVAVQRESSTALGQGFRLGFAGALHLEIFCQRLDDEYGVEVLVTRPTVNYRVEMRGGEVRTVANPADWPPDASTIVRCDEPMVRAEIIVPNDRLGPVMQLCAECRGDLVSHDTMEGRGHLIYQLPMAEIADDFRSALHSATSGFASCELDDRGEYRRATVQLLQLMLNGEPVDALSQIVHADSARRRGVELVKRLKEVVRRQQFAIAVQAAVGNKVIARETIAPFRKNVTAKLYGGDVTRKRKLLEKQKKGKKRMRSIGTIEVPPEAFSSVLGKGVGKG